MRKQWLALKAPNRTLRTWEPNNSCVARFCHVKQAIWHAKSGSSTSNCIRNCRDLASCNPMPPVLERMKAIPRPSWSRMPQHTSRTKRTAAGLTRFSCEHRPGRLFVHWHHAPVGSIAVAQRGGDCHRQP